MRSGSYSFGIGTNSSNWKLLDDPCWPQVRSSEKGTAYKGVISTTSKKLFKIQMQTNPAIITLTFAAFMSATEAHSSSIALDMNLNLRSQRQSLRRCTSLQSDLSQSSEDACNLGQSQSSYSPAHTPLLETVYLRQRRITTDRINRTKPTNDNSDRPRIYTRLQTQLYPEMRF